jgi:hypothetical protein
MDHDPVGAAIDPALVRIARDVVAAGAYIASAIRVMPLGGGKFQDVHIVAAHDVLHDRT